MILDRIKVRGDAIKKDHPDDAAWQSPVPTVAQVVAIKAEADNATLLLDALHRTKKPDAFWAQVIVQNIAANIQEKPRLFLDIKAQAVQVTESRWYASDRILASGEVQVA